MDAAGVAAFMKTGQHFHIEKLQPSVCELA